MNYEIRKHINVSAAKNFCHDLQILTLIQFQSVCVLETSCHSSILSTLTNPIFSSLSPFHPLFYFLSQYSSLSPRQQSVFSSNILANNMQSKIELKLIVATLMLAFIVQFSDTSSKFNAINTEQCGEQLNPQERAHNSDKSSSNVKNGEFPW